MMFEIDFEWINPISAAISALLCFITCNLYLVLPGAVSTLKMLNIKKLNLFKMERNPNVYTVGAHFTGIE